MYVILPKLFDWDESKNETNYCSIQCQINLIEEFMSFSDLIRLIHCCYITNPI
jgi:hypothetical protein